MCTIFGEIPNEKRIHLYSAGDLGSVASATAKNLVLGFLIQSARARADNPTTLCVNTSLTEEIVEGETATATATKYGVGIFGPERLVFSVVFGVSVVV